MLRKVKLLLLPVIMLALVDLLFRPLQGESFGRGMDLVLEWVVTSALVWMLTLFPLAASLKESGFTAHGSHLESILNGTWTTSSELIGELGAAVIAIRKECKPLSVNQKALAKQCLREVLKAWPGFGLFSWFPFGR